MRALQRAFENQEESTNRGDDHLQREGRMVQRCSLPLPLSPTLFLLHFPPHSPAPRYRASDAASNGFRGEEAGTAWLLAPCRAPVPVPAPPLSSLPLSPAFSFRHDITPQSPSPRRDGSSNQSMHAPTNEIALRLRPTTKATVH